MNRTGKNPPPTAIRETKGNYIYTVHICLEKVLVLRENGDLFVFRECNLVPKRLALVKLETDPV